MACVMRATFCRHIDCVCYACGRFLVDGNISTKIGQVRWLG